MKKIKKPILVHKVFVGNLETEQIPKYMKEVSERMKEDGLIQFFVPTYIESEHPIECIYNG